MKTSSDDTDICVSYTLYILSICHYYNLIIFIVGDQSIV